MTRPPENFDPPYEPVDPGRWQVRLAVDPEETEVIERAAPTVLPGERVWIHVEPPEPGAEPDVSLLMLIHTDERDKAIDRALYDYGRIRTAAGLDPRPGTVLGYQSPWWREGRRGAELGREAHQLHKDKRHELAVIRIQTAGEIHVLKTYAELLKRHPQATALREIRFKPSLMDRQSKALLQVVTGRRIQDEAWWPNYCNHMKRRNLIVHEGLEVDYAGAVASLDVAIALGRWLIDVRRAASDEDAQDDAT